MQLFGHHYLQKEPTPAEKCIKTKDSMKNLNSNTQHSMQNSFTKSHNEHSQTKQQRLAIVFLLVNHRIAPKPTATLAFLYKSQNPN